MINQIFQCDDRFFLVVVRIETPPVWRQVFRLVMGLTLDGKPELTRKPQLSGEISSRATHLGGGEARHNFCTRDLTNWTRRTAEKTRSSSAEVCSVSRRNRRDAWCNFNVTLKCLRALSRWNRPPPLFFSSSTRLLICTTVFFRFRHLSKELIVHSCFVRTVTLTTSAKNNKSNLSFGTQVNTFRSNQHDERGRIFLSETKFKLIAEGNDELARLSVKGHVDTSDTFGNTNDLLSCFFLHPN